MEKVNIGLIGLGTVGEGVAKTLFSNRLLFKSRCGIDINLKSIAEKRWGKKRAVKIPASMRARDAMAIVNDPEIDIVVELIGGIGDARKYIEAALRLNKHVVTANKALLAEKGKRIFALADKCGADLYYEASVCGAIPIIKALREGLASNRILSIFGIVNGTCNYILSRMTDGGITFETALEEAKRLGYAEADPSLDINGYDSAHKLAILATLASGCWVPLDAVHVEGISGIGQQDIAYAREFHCSVKLLAIYKQVGSAIEARVHPTLISESHLLASVRGSYNAVCVNADPAGEIVLYGAGAGRKPAASAVVADIIDIARNIARGAVGRVPVIASTVNNATMREMDEVETQNYLRFSVIDRPGVLAGITGILGELQISIAAVLQTERRQGSVVPVVIMTHAAKERNMRRALARIDRLPFVKAKTMVIRVEEKL